METNQHKTFVIFILLFFALFILFFLDIISGNLLIKFRDILDLIRNPSIVDETIRTIIINFRIPKAITAILAGAALSVSGLQMQTVFRNPLAGPYVLGISAGASLGVAITLLGLSAFFAGTYSPLLGNWTLAFSACIGAGIMLVIILVISSRIKDIMTILIIGILLSGVVSAIVDVIQYFSNETSLKAYVIWTMGSLSNLSGQQLIILTVIICFGLLISLFSSKSLNALLLGESYANTLGVNVKITRIVIFSGTSLLTGCVTAFCGPIGFIGIAIPHVSRLIFNSANHFKLIPGSILIGSIFMLISDIISHFPGYDKVLPINSITALIGIPVIIWIIFKNQRFSTFS